MVSVGCHQSIDEEYHVQVNRHDLKEVLRERINCLLRTLGLLTPSVVQ